MTAEDDPYRPRPVDLERPSVARVYDYLLGGTAHWAVDRDFANRVLGRFPLLRSIARANRRFLGRAVQHLGGLGVRQFVDIGSGVPTMGTTHEVADADARVVYVDNDPVVVAQARVLLERTGDPVRHAAVAADLRAPDVLWQRIADSGVVDIGQPLALLVIAVLNVRQPDPATGSDVGPVSVARYRELLPVGSYLAVSHFTADGVPPDVAADLRLVKRFYEESGTSLISRDRAEIAALFGDFDLVAPGLVWTPDWHPEYDDETEPFSSPAHSATLAGVGRKHR
nr:SAM-dependent methyltransferase [Actinokineospora inagensis]